MYSNYRKSLLTSAIALALVSTSGIAIAGSNCDKDESHKGKNNQSYKANKANMQNQDVSAARQESQIQTTYSLNSNLRDNDLQVSVKDGKATLTGTVEEEVSKELANTIALNADGINDVDNQIKVESDYTPSAHNSQERSFGDLVDDASITATVKSKLLWSKNTEGLEMDVDTENGKVTLTGAAESEVAKSQAAATAANTRGVVSVDNRLVVDSTNAQSRLNNDYAQGASYGQDSSYGQDASSEISDGWITSKVNSTYMFSSSVDSNDIDVSTDQGIVTLKGEVDNDSDRAQAIELAKNIRGVKSVDATDLTLSDRTMSLTGTGLTQNLSNPETE